MSVVWGMSNEGTFGESLSVNNFSFAPFCQHSQYSFNVIAIYLTKKYFSVHKFTIHRLFFQEMGYAPTLSIMDWINWNLLIRFFAKCFMCINFPSLLYEVDFIFYVAFLRHPWRWCWNSLLWIIPSYKDYHYFPLSMLRGLLWELKNYYN